MDLGCCWAKTNASGRPHSLIGHLLDAAATAELIWGFYLAPKVKRQLDEVSDGRGRDLLVLLAAWHDLGKATPAFQLRPDARWPESATALEAAGLSIPPPLRSASDWPHPHASAVIAQQLLSDAGATGWEWLLPLIDGHHGLYKADPRPFLSRHRRHQGDAGWQELQVTLAHEVADRMSVRLERWALRSPTRGVQLALGGLVIMADWIASSDLFPGVGLADQTLAATRERAVRAWEKLSLNGGWTITGLLNSIADFEGRFGFRPRPLQTLVLAAASAAPAPGLLVIEAPMGEGKTEAAEAASEALARATGCSGVVFAMPTQGTTDAMYDRVVKWMAEADPTVPVSLLHGKAMLNEKWREALTGIAISGVFAERTDQYGLPDEYDPFGTSAPEGRRAPAPSSWLLGRHRGLLAPAAVATVDQVLWAATRTKYVALRHAGLAGRVLIVDEVHSYDAHMGVFLHELLRWCARSDVPVVLMSATLPPGIRTELVSSWREGAGLPLADPVTVMGYPSVLAAGHDGGLAVTYCAPHREDLILEVRTLLASDPEDIDAIASGLFDEVAPGGCALAILNTVRRAQEVFRRLVEWEVPALLIHGRLTASERARRTQEALDALGPEGVRPGRLVVVATQIAEQSFDVDADILFSDVAPMDLLLQRVGRLHRHARKGGARPVHLRAPRLVVTGLAWTDGHPTWPAAFAKRPDAEAPDPRKPPRTVYRPYPLLATAAQLRAGTTWAIPSQVPKLVAEAYAAEWQGPGEWRSLVENARSHEEAERLARQQAAATFRLDEFPSTDAKTLWGLHARASSESDDGRRPIVRDGDDTLEVCLIRRDKAGLRTLNGRSLGMNGERVSDDDVAREVLGDSVRLRWRPELQELGPLPQWMGHPLLGFTPVLVLDADGAFRSGRWAVRYDSELGLTES